VLFGREQRLEGAANPLHWYGPIGSAPEQYPDAAIWTERDARWSPMGMGKGDVGCGLFRVSTYGSTATRTATGGQSLTTAQLNGRGELPTGTALAFRPSVWVELELAESASRSIIIDAGQTVFVYADTLTVKWWAPGPLNVAGARWVDLGPGNSPYDVVSFETPVSEGLLYCQIARVEAPRQQGQDFALFTQSYYVPAGEEPGQLRAVPIPTGARRIYAARNNAGVVTATRLELGFSDGTIAQSISTIPINDSQSSFGPAQLANTTHLLLPILAEGVLWTITWEIAP
jgi:hypothetical protein